jgi:hypothetical protein
MAFATNEVYAGSNPTFGSSAFGYITTQANSPRNIQAALKLFF